MENFIRKFTPRIERINKDIEKKFQEMGANISATDLNFLSLWRREFYLKITKDGNELWMPEQDKGGHDVDDISLDTFWGGYPVTDDLGNQDHRAKISDDNLDLIASSGIFLIKKIHFEHEEDSKTLARSVYHCYLELSGRQPEKWEYQYHVAEFLTKLGSDEKAWPYLYPCIPNLTLEEADFEWITELRNSILHKAKEEPSISIKADRYIELAELTWKIDALLGSGHGNDKSGSDEGESNEDRIDVIKLYLKAIRYLYLSALDNSFIVSDKIQGCDPDVLFSVACRAYRQGSEKEKEEEIAKRFLTISRDCFRILIESQKISNYDCTEIIDVFLGSDQPGDQRFLRILKSSIFIEMGQALWGEEEECKNLCLKASEMFYELNPQARCGAKWNPEILVALVDDVASSTHSSLNGSIWGKIMNDFCQELVYCKYKTDAYLSALRYFQEAEMWGRASQLADKVGDLVYSPDDLQALKEQMASIVCKTKEEKVFLINKFSEIISCIINNIKNSRVLKEQGERYVRECLITQEQWNYLINQGIGLEIAQSTINYMASQGDRGSNFHEEKNSFVEYIHEILGLPQKLRGLPEGWHLPGS